MELIYTGNFRRDYQKLNNRYLFKLLNESLIQIKNAPGPQHVPFLKKLKRYENIYRLELRVSKLKIYWVVCTIVGNKIYLRRLKTESWLKKQLRSYKPD